MEETYINNMNGRSDMRSGGEKRRLKTLEMSTKKKPRVE
jgi:hypothetical protein